jgi:glycosyltransferase involved in cell wall biosynthesis
VLARTVLRRPRFIAVAPHVRDGLVSIGIKPGQIDVIPNGVPIPGASFPSGTAPTRIGLLGRFDPGKGMLEFTEAAVLSGLHPPQAVFSIGGSSGFFREYEEQVRSRAKEAGIAVEQPREGVAFLEGQDVVVIPSRYEGSPLVLLEAMALGKAVIGTNVAGITSITGLGDRVILVPVDDASALASEIRSLATDAPRQVALGRAARTWVIDRYSLSALTERALDLAERVGDVRT